MPQAFEDHDPGGRVLGVRVTHAILLAVVGALLGAAVVGAALLWPRTAPSGGVVQPGEEVSDRLVPGTIIDIVETGADPIGMMPGATEVAITAVFDETGEAVAFTQVDDTGDTFRSGQRVVLDVLPQPDGTDLVYIADFQRSRPLIALTLAFVLSVVAFGRWQGVRALIGLVTTFAVLVWFIVPAILDGRSPLVVAMVGALVIMIATLYLAHGFSAKTTSAVVGTAIALALTGLLSAAFVSAASLTGFTSDEARLATIEAGGLSLSGLLLAGILIGGLGVLDDVTMSQASTVFELRKANPSATVADLLRGALNVGRDHVAATVNTLFLAYAGASLPLLLLFSVGNAGFVPVITSELVAVEVVRTLVGSLGLIAAVPVTTFLAAALAVGDPAAVANDPGHGHTHGPLPDLDGPEAEIGPEPSASAEPTRAADGAVPVTDDAPPTGGSPREAGARGVAAEPEQSVEAASQHADGEPDWVDRLRDAYGVDAPADDDR